MKDLINKKEIWTIKEVLMWTAGYLERKGCETPRLDAELLLAHALGIKRLGLYLDFDRPLTDGERFQYRELVRRRSLREPVALITGKKEFWSLDITIRPGVLIPRPETEILVEVVLGEFRTLHKCSILEVGCGSGALICAICRENPNIEVYACDISLNALNNTFSNTSAKGLPDRVHLFGSDLLDSVRKAPVFDIIYSNPPYIPSGLICSLAPEICKFEPNCALDGGPDGLETIRRLIQMSRDRLKPQGRLILEIGDEQSEPVREIFELNHYSQIQTYTDLSGKVRVVKAVL